MARPKNPDKKKQLNIYVDPDVCEWIESKAKKEDRTTSQFVNRIIKKEMDLEQNR